MKKPQKKRSLVKDSWTPEQRKRYEKAYAELEEEFRPWLEAIRDAERLTATDYNLRINC